MVRHATSTTPSPTLEERIEEFRREQARRLAEGYDPEREMGILLRKYFGREALEETYREYKREKNIIPDPDDPSTDDGR